MFEISVIIPIYNCEQYLNICLKSILNQTYKNFEVILVDDGSTDKSGSICTKYSKQYDNFSYYHKDNEGVSSARNLGIENAIGKYIVFVDSDDIVTPLYLENLIKYKKYDLVITSYKLRFYSEFDNFTDKNIGIKELSGKNVDDLDASFFIDGKMHACWAKLYKKSIIDKYKIRFSTDMRLSEDSLFNLQYLQHINSWITVNKNDYIYIKYYKHSTATNLYFESDLECYITLQNTMINMNLNKKIINNTIFPQYLGLCLKVLKNNELNENYQKRLIKNLLKNRIVKKTLITTYTNMFERILTLLIVTNNIKLAKYLLSK